MGCGPQYQVISQIDKTLARLRNLGIDELSPLYRQLYRARGAAFGSIGFKVPRNVLSILRIFGLSPGSLQLFFDVETGFLVEIKDRPGALPRYKPVDEETAVKMYNRELDQATHDRLFAPDEYLGE